jgi:phenylacetate-CoA ligase
VIWNKKFETMPFEERRKVQSKSLAATVKRVYERVPFYRRAFDAKGLKPADIRSVDDLKHLPFTSKQDLRDNYPYGLFTVPMDKVVRIHSSSGTTGKPTVVGYTKEDINIWSEVMARSFGCAEVGPGDIIQNAYGYGMFTGGLGAHYGGEYIGSTIIPISGGNTKRQIMVLEDFGATCLCCTPSYSLYIAEVAAEMGVDIKKLPLRVGVFGAEPWSDQIRDSIEENLAIDALDIYGISEIIGPGVSMECMQKNGLHIFDDHFLPEIIDPTTGEVLDWGQKGELVFTTITKEAFPLLRYRTRDMTSLTPETCPCGRTHVRMKRVSGRTDDMLIIRGVNVFPSQIESVLVGIEEAEPHYQLILRREGSLDTLEVQVEVSERFFSDEIKELEGLQQKIRNEIESVLGLSTRVKLVEPRSIARSEGKAKRVIDERPK